MWLKSITNHMDNVEVFTIFDNNQGKENYDWLLYLDPNINTRKSFNLNLVKNYKDEVINFYKRFIA